MAETLWLAADAAQATGGTIIGDGWSASGFSIDTRSLQPGDLFLALPGEKMDGHRFLNAAHEKGAAAAMVTRSGLAKHPAPEGLPLLVIPENISIEGLPSFPDASTNPGDAAFQALLASPIFIALWKLADAARKRSKAGIVAITGSVGKTSAKEALTLALSGCAKQGAAGVHATRGNFNNHIGLPLTLAAMPPQSEFAVLEMGMNHAGEIAPLSKLARPDVALITNVEAVHAEFFESVEGIARAKAEIFAGIAQENGAVVLPRDNSFFHILSSEAQKRNLKICSFGSVDPETTDFYLSEVISGADGTQFAVLSGYETQKTHGKMEVYLRAVGVHWSLIATAAIACVSSLGLNSISAIRALADFQEPEGRGRLQNVTIAGKRVTLMDDSYNASPVSMRGAIEKLSLLAKLEKRRPVAVLGQMLELGETGPAAHLGLGEVLAANGVQDIFLCGANMLPLVEANPAMYFAETAAALRPAVEAALQEGDILLVKGSHGSKVYTLAEVWLHAAEAMHGAA